MRGLDLPVYFGNRNWEPYVEDAVAAMRDNGVRRAAVFTTSAWGGYSSCTQYIEDIARGRQAAGDRAPELVKLRQYFDHPLFVEMFTEAIADAAHTLPEQLRDDARLVFTAHSIPVAGPLPLRHRPLRPPGRIRVTARRNRGGLRRLRPGVAVAVRAATGALAGTRCRRPSVGPGRRGHQSGHRLPDRIRRRPHRGGVGSGQRAASAGRGRPASRSPGPAPPMPTAASHGLSVDLIEELRRGREPVRVEGPDAPPLQGFSINGALCTPELRLALAPPGRLQDRADRGQPGRAHHRSERPQRIVGDLRLRRTLQADRHQSRTDGDDCVDVCGVLQHPQRPRRGMVGRPVLPEDSSTCSTSLRGSATSTPPASARMAPSASAADLTADRSAYSASPRSRCSAIGAPGSEYTVQPVPDSSASSVSSESRSRRIRSRGPGRPPVDDGPPLTMIASPRSPRRAGTGCPRAGRGHRRVRAAQRRSLVRRPATPAAVRSVCSSDMVPEWFTSGQGRPVLPAATASYAVTECLGAQCG